MIAWKAGPDGEVLDANSAPDGDIYIAAALLVAHGHWCVNGHVYRARPIPWISGRAYCVCLKAWVGVEVQGLSMWVVVLQGRGRLPLRRASHPGGSSRPQVRRAHN